MSDIVERLRSVSGCTQKTFMHRLDWDDGKQIIVEAVSEIERLRAALTQFVAACETAPPTSLMIEIGMACKVAKRALALPSDQCGGGA